MVTKDNLIGMLEKSLFNEDEFIISYGEDFLNRVLVNRFLNGEEKREIKSLMTAVLQDTQRHKETIELLIQKIKEDRRNEF